MLKDLTPKKSVDDEIKYMKEICVNAGLDPEIYAHPQTEDLFHIETGIYWNYDNFNFDEYCWQEKIDCYNSNDKFIPRDENGEIIWDEDWIDRTIVADNLEQIKEYYKEVIEDPDDFVLTIGRVNQDKNSEGGGWRWHKWGEYIGKYNPQCEYLDDEDFGPEFQGYVLIAYLYRIIK